MVTNYQMNAWNRWQHATAMRQAQQAREREIARLMAAPPKPLPVNPQLDRETAMPARQLGLELI